MDKIFNTDLQDLTRFGFFCWIYKSTLPFTQQYWIIVELFMPVAECIRDCTGIFVHHNCSLSRLDSNSWQTIKFEDSLLNKKRTDLKA